MKKFFVGCVVCGSQVSKVTKCYVWIGNEKKLIRHDGDEEYIEKDGKRYYPEDQKAEEPEKEEQITENQKSEEPKEPEQEKPMAEEPRQAEPEQKEAEHKTEDRKVEEPESKEPKEQAKKSVKSGWDMESDRIPDIVPPQFSKPVDIALSVTAFIVAAAYWLGVWLRGSMIQAVYRFIDTAIVAGFWIAGIVKGSRVWMPRAIDKTKLVVYGAIYKVMIGLVWAIKTTAILVYMVGIAIY